MTEKKSDSDRPTWTNAVVAGISDALLAVRQDDPLGVQAMLGAAMAAARLEELRRSTESPTTLAL